MNIAMSMLPKWATDNPKQYKDHWFRKLMTVNNNSLPDTCKMVMYTLYDEFSKKEGDDSGFIPVYYGDSVPGEGITGKTGYSRFLVSRTVKSLVDAGILCRRKESVDGKSHIHLSPTAVFYDPLNCRLKDKREWGGNRAKCPSCGSDKLKVETRVTCKSCGETFTAVGDYHIHGGHMYYDNRPAISFWDNKNTAHVCLYPRAVFFYFQSRSRACRLGA